MTTTASSATTASQSAPSRHSPPSGSPTPAPPARPLLPACGSAGSPSPPRSSATSLPSRASRTAAPAASTSSRWPSSSIPATTTGRSAAPGLPTGSGGIGSSAPCGGTHPGCASSASRLASTCCSNCRTARPNPTSSRAPPVTASPLKDSVPTGGRQARIRLPWWSATAHRTNTPLPGQSNDSLRYSPGPPDERGADPEPERLVRLLGPGLRSSDRSDLRLHAPARGDRSRRASRVLADDLRACSRPRGSSMTIYMYQASYTAKSMAAQLTEPHDPMEAISPVLEELGAKVLVAGFPFGEYDVLIVYEAPDDVTAASVAMAVAAAGEVKSAKTTRLLSGQEWLESLRKRRIVTMRKRASDPPRG